MSFFAKYLRAFGRSSSPYALASRPLRDHIRHNLFLEMRYGKLKRSRSVSSRRSRTVKRKKVSRSVSKPMLTGQFRSTRLRVAKRKFKVRKGNNFKYKTESVGTGLVTSTLGRCAIVSSFEETTGDDFDLFFQQQYFQSVQAFSTAATPITSWVMQDGSTGASAVPTVNYFKTLPKIPVIKNFSTFEFSNISNSCAHVEMIQCCPKLPIEENRIVATLNAAASSQVTVHVPTDTTHVVTDPLVMRSITEIGFKWTDSMLFNERFKILKSKRFVLESGQSYSCGFNQQLYNLVGRKIMTNLTSIAGDTVVTPNKDDIGLFSYHCFYICRVRGQVTVNDAGAVTYAPTQVAYVRRMFKDYGFPLIPKPFRQISGRYTNAVVTTGTKALIMNDEQDEKKDYEDLA